MHSEYRRQNMGQRNLQRAWTLLSAAVRDRLDPENKQTTNNVLCGGAHLQSWPLGHTVKDTLIYIKWSRLAWDPE